MVWAHSIQAQPVSNNVNVMAKRLASAANRNGEGGRLDAQRSLLSENVVDIGIGELLKNWPLRDRDSDATYETV